MPPTRSARRKNAKQPALARPKITIHSAFAEFLSELRSKVAARTAHEYASILELFDAYLDRYAYQEEGDKETEGFASRYGPERLLGGYGEFYGYYLPGKVMCSRTTYRTAGKVGKQLAMWLGERGYVTRKAAAEAAALVSYKGKELAEIDEDEETADGPDWAGDNLRYRLRQICSSWDGAVTTEFEDHFLISKVTPRELWLEPTTTGHRRIRVPIPAGVGQDELRLGSTLHGVVEQKSKGWRLAEVFELG